MRRTIAILAITFCLCASRAGAEIVIGLAAPLQGQNAALGEQIRRGAQQAIDDINAAGGVRGEFLALNAADDACDPRKAVDVASRFVAAGTRFVVGHYCSGSSIPASKIYEAAGVLQISPSSSIPKFTDEGGWNVFRTCPREDAQGSFAGRYIGGRYRDAKIAILADQTPSNGAIAAKAREALNAMGVTEAVFETYVAGSRNYDELSQRMVAAGVTVIYIAGAYPEAAIILKEARALTPGVQLISDDALVTDEFWNLAGETAEGTLMTFLPDPLKIEAAQSIVAKFRERDQIAEGHTLHAYAAVQAMVRAMDATAGTDARKMAEWLRGGTKISTVLGNIGFDTKGDLASQEFVWLRWVDGKFIEAADLNKRL
jgi:branched-chain amino acid transport system substrate-binding protein